MNDDRIDFSPIDPSRDRERWKRTIESIAARAAAAPGAPRPLSAQLAAWTGPALALAAGVALLVWLAAPPAGPPAPQPAPDAPREDPAFALQRWALGERTRSLWDELAKLGVGHEQF